MLPHHLDDELQHFLSNGYPLQKIRQLLHATIERAKFNSSKSHSRTDSNLVTSIPYFKSSASSLKKSLAPSLLLLYAMSKMSYTKFRVGIATNSILTKPDVRLIKRIKQHEACFRPGVANTTASLGQYFCSHS